MITVKFSFFSLPRLRANNREKMRNQKFSDGSFGLYFLPSIRVIVTGSSACGILKAGIPIIGDTHFHFPSSSLSPVVIVISRKPAVFMALATVADEKRNTSGMPKRRNKALMRKKPDRSMVSEILFMHGSITSMLPPSRRQR